MSEDRHFTVSDSGHGRSGTPGQASPDQFFGSLGIAWYAVATVATKYPRAREVATILRHNGFSASFVVELFGKVESLGPTLFDSILDHWPLTKDTP